MFPTAKGTRSVAIGDLSSKRGSDMALLAHVCAHPGKNARDLWGFRKLQKFVVAEITR